MEWGWRLENGKRRRYSQLRRSPSQPWFTASYLYVAWRSRCCATRPEAWVHNRSAIVAFLRDDSHICYRLRSRSERPGVRIPSGSSVFGLRSSVFGLRSSVFGDLVTLCADALHFLALPIAFSFR